MRALRTVTRLAGLLEKEAAWVRSPAGQGRLATATRLYHEKVRSAREPLGSASRWVVRPPADPLRPLSHGC